MAPETRKRIARTGLAAWLLILVKFILFKHQAYVYQHYFRDAYPLYSLREGWEKANMTPFKNIALILRQNDIYHYWLGNITGNIAGFMPLGFLFPLTRQSPCKPAAVLLFTGLVSACFECAQWFLGTGILDIDDLILNIAGGMLGWLVLTILKSLYAVKQAD